MTDELAAQTLPPKCIPVKKHKHGDTREDGKVFYRYTPHCLHGEQWVTKEQFDRYRKNERDRVYSDLEGYQKYQREWRARNKERSRQHTKNWRKKNPKYFAKLSFKKRRENPLFDLRGRLRSRIYLALKKRKASTTTQQYLGASIKEVFLFLEAQFFVGMSWENRKDWHIDHIVPLSCAETRKEIIILCHYSNLCPIWKLDNLIKSSTIPDKIPENIHPNIRKIWQRHQSKKEKLPTPQ